MGKMIPTLILAGMGAMLVISWSNVLTFDSKKDAALNNYIKEAEKKEEQGIYIDAVAQYERAFAMSPDNYELAMKIVSMYDKLEQKEKAIYALEQATQADPTQKEPYIRMMDYYLEKSQNKKVFEVGQNAEKNIGMVDEIESRLKVLRSAYTEHILQAPIDKPMHYLENGDYGRMVVFTDNGKVLYSFDMDKVPAGRGYEEVGFLNDKLSPVKMNGEYYYVDENGYRKLVTEEKADYLGTFVSGYAPACFNGSYCYIDKTMKKYQEGYQFAGGFENGVACVQEKNGKWSVINTTFAKVADEEFDEVLHDEYGFCSTFGVFIAKKDGKYYIYGTDGIVRSEGYDDAKMFASDQPAAMKKGSKWIYVSIDGEEVLTTEAEDAKSFCIGYGPVKMNGKWGCIDPRGIELIEPKFDNMEPFDKKGYAVCTSNGVDEYISVTVY